MYTPLLLRQLEPSASCDILEYRLNGYMDACWRAEAGDEGRGAGDPSVSSGQRAGRHAPRVPSDNAQSWPARGAQCSPPQRDVRCPLYPMTQDKEGDGAEDEGAETDGGAAQRAWGAKNGRTDAGMRDAVALRKDGARALRWWWARSSRRPGSGREGKSRGQATVRTVAVGGVRGSRADKGGGRRYERDPGRSSEGTQHHANGRITVRLAPASREDTPSRRPQRNSGRAGLRSRRRGDDVDERGGGRRVKEGDGSGCGSRGHRLSHGKVQNAPVAPISLCPLCSLPGNAYGSVSWLSRFSLRCSTGFIHNIASKYNDEGTRLHRHPRIPSSVKSLQTTCAAPWRRAFSNLEIIVRAADAIAAIWSVLTYTMGRFTRMRGARWTFAPSLEDKGLALVKQTAGCHALFIQECTAHGFCGKYLSVTIPHSWSSFTHWQLVPFGVASWNVGNLLQFSPSDLAQTKPLGSKAQDALGKSATAASNQTSAKVAIRKKTTLLRRYAAL
ncbi:hypothetical protein FB451DRAFT_1186702 [Mycena latifolia]|nr:hypothetical protein FB451DRAFT_1186702 [Mycena latifolia]